MKKYNLIAVLGTLLLASSGYAGFDRGGGGDSVFCRASSENSLIGYYSLDFVLEASDTETVQVKSWEESAARLQTVLKAKSPYLAASFEDFIKHHKSTNRLLYRVWEKSKSGLFDIKDEQLPKRLPENCFEKVAGGVRVIQTVYRGERSDQIVYAYDPQILEILYKQQPLQYSFLMVHEWLRDFTEDVEAIRRFNAFLHTSELEKISSFDLFLYTERVGLRNSNEVFPICARSPMARAAVQSMEGKGCEAIKFLERASLAKEVRLEDRFTKYLKPFDLVGMSAVETVTIEGTNLASFPEWIFSYTPSVKKIHLTLPSAYNLFDRTFSGLKLEEVVLRGRGGMHLGPLLFSSAKSVRKIALYDLASYPARIFAGVRGLESVAFYDNVWGGEFPKEIIDLAGSATVFYFCPNDFSAREQKTIQNHYQGRVRFDLKCRTSGPGIPPSLPSAPPLPRTGYVCWGMCDDSENRVIGNGVGYGADKNGAYEELMKECGRIVGENNYGAQTVRCQQADANPKPPSSPTGPPLRGPDPIKPPRPSPKIECRGECRISLGFSLIGKVNGSGATEELAMESLNQDCRRIGGRPPRVLVLNVTCQ